MEKTSRASKPETSLDHQGTRLGPAFIEAAQGTNSQDIGPCLPIVLGLGSKEVNFTPTRVRALKSRVAAADLALWRNGSCPLFFLPRRLPKTSGSGNVPAADHFGRSLLGALGEPACRHGGRLGFRRILVRALRKSRSGQCRRPARIDVVCTLCRRRRVPFQER